MSFRVSRRCVHDSIARTLVATLRITALTNAGSVPVGEKRPGMRVTFGRASGYEKKAKAGATARARSDRDNSCFEVRIREEASFADNCGYGILLCNAISSAAIAESGTRPMSMNPRFTPGEILLDRALRIGDKYHLSATL